MSNAIKLTRAQKTLLAQVADHAFHKATWATYDALIKANLIVWVAWTGYQITEEGRKALEGAK